MFGTIVLGLLLILTIYSWVTAGSNSNDKDYIKKIRRPYILIFLVILYILLERLI